MRGNIYSKDEDEFEGEARLRQVSYEIKQVKRQINAKFAQQKEIDLSSAWRKRQLVQVHRIARSMAYTQKGPKKRYYNTLPSTRPTKDEWLKNVSLPGTDGGLAAYEICFPDFNGSGVDSMPPLPAADLNDIELAKEDMRATTHELINTSKRKFAPKWSLPEGIEQMIAEPQYLSKPSMPSFGVGFMPMFDIENRPDNRLLEIPHLTEPKQEMEEIFKHVRRAGRTPRQANVSQTFALDKKKSV